MSDGIQNERRWLKSVIAASAEPLPNFPWMRGHRPDPVVRRAALDCDPVQLAQSLSATPRRVTLAAR